MTKEDKRDFVGSLMKSVRLDVLKKINEGSIPKEWDGIELRQYIADKFAASVYPMRQQRRVDYDNTIRCSPDL